MREGQRDPENIEPDPAAADKKDFRRRKSYVKHESGNKYKQHTFSELYGSAGEAAAGAYKS